MMEHELKCKHCNRYMGKAIELVGTLQCPNSSCKAETQFKIVNLDVTKSLGYEFKEAPKAPKKKDKEATE